MTRRLLPLLLAPALLLAADSTPGPLDPRKAARSAVLPDGFRATVFAAEPDVVQPVSFTIDERGRVWVAEALEYGLWKATGKDRVVILEDQDGDGRADRRTVFHEGFNYITGLEVGFGGVWVVSPPKLYFVPDRDGDGKPDGPPEVVFDGFGYKESRHNLVNGFTWGPDGWLYGGHGRTTPSDVGPPGTPTEKRIHCDGGVFRVHPTRRVFENFADGTTNPWGVDFDDFGACFVSNCVNPHLFHLIQGGHYEPWRNRPSSLYAYDRLPTCADHLHFPTDKPKEMRGETPSTLAMGGGHAHCGTLVYLGDRFPADFRNTVLMCNVHGRRINHDLLRRKGSGYTASHGKDFFISADPWFMGVTLRTGPDGNVLVSDWSDTGECHTYKPNRHTGRIYKISYAGREEKKFAPLDLAKLGDAELVKLQMHANDWYVRHARRLLQERAADPRWKGEAVHDALRAMLASPRHAVPQRLRALWALRVTSGIDEARLVALLDDRAEHLRAWAIQLLCEDGKPPETALAKFRALAKDDPSPVVRLYLASALQRLPLVRRWDIAEGLLRHADDAGDANLPLMVWYGVEPLVPADPERALRLAAGAHVPLVRRYIARRAVDDATLKKDNSDLDNLVGVLSTSSTAARLDLLLGARDSLRGRKSMKMPKGWPAAYAKLSADSATREPAVFLALLFGDPQAMAELRKTARAIDAPAAERVKALESLIEKRVPDLAPVLHDLLGDRSVRRAALRGLAAYAHEKTPEIVLARFAGLTLEEKQDAVATLASRKEYALALLAAVEKKVVAHSDVSAYVARQLHAMGDRQVTERLRTVWGEVRDSSPQKRKLLTRYKGQLTPAALKRGDPAGGRVLFAKACASCHKLFGDGGTIGPDLTGSNRTDLDYLLSNLIDPSAEVGRDYRMSTVTTADGRVVTGIIVERAANRLVVQTATEKAVLAKDDVEAIKESSQSMMPEGILDAMSREQVRDLFAYLASKTQIPLPAGKGG